MKTKYTGINCSNCGRFVGKDGFHDYDSESREIGYPLCKHCLDAQGPTICDLETKIEELEHQRDYQGCTANDIEQLNATRTELVKLRQQLSKKR